MEIDYLNIYVGRHWTEIRVEQNPLQPEYVYRLIRPNDIVTLDLNLKRINIFVDENGIVKEFNFG